MPNEDPTRAPGPLTVHLVRHAAHGLLPHTLAGRMPGVGLSTEGRAQAQALATRFRGEALAAVVSSPVRRALETAEPLAASAGRLLQVDAGWTEIDFGDWTGQRFDALAGDPDWERWNRLRSLAAPPNGEAMHAAQSRALAALNRLRADHAGGTVAVVSHADIIKAMLAPVLGLSLDRLHRITVDPGSVSTLVVFADDLRVDGLNR